MKLMAIAAAAALTLTVAGCATEESELPDTPDIVSEDTNEEGNDANEGSANDSEDSEGDGVQRIDVEVDPYQSEQFLQAAEQSLSLAAENGYIEEYTIPGATDSTDGTSSSEPFSEAVIFDATKPIEEAAALRISEGIAAPLYVTSTDEVFIGLIELSAKAESIIGIINSGAEEASQYTNVITNDGFIFNDPSTNDRFHVKTNEDGIITSFTAGAGENERTHTFSYSLTEEQKDLITQAYEMEFEEGVPEE